MEVVIASCHKYADAWGPFRGLMQKFWPDRPYNAVLVTDQTGPEWKGEFRQTGADLGWSANLRHGLDLLDSEFVLLMQEDFFFSDTVDTPLVRRALKVIQGDSDINCIRLMPCPGPDGEDYNEDFGRITIGAPYRVSYQAAIWRKSALDRILHYTRGPASFEIEGTIMRPEGEYLSVHRKLPFPFSYLVSAITRGEWERDAIIHCMKNLVPIDPSKRPVRSVQGLEG